MSVLCLNAGSSSLKLALHSGGGDGRIASGAVEGIGAADGRVRLAPAGGGPTVDERREITGHREALALALDALDGLGLPPPHAAGHRFTHGGLRFAEPVVVDNAVVEGLRSLVPLAPLHLPAQITTLQAVAARMPGLPQVACFDTAFHRRMPEAARRLPLPGWAWEAGIRRFGFHGLSYEHVVDVLGAASGRVVIAHLGYGASLAAVRDGAPTDTTMAFTPAAGIVMGTRPGDLDPGVLVHLMRERGMDVDAVDRLVNHESGLLGISGTTGDMRHLLAVRRTDPRADMAVTMFCDAVRRAVGSLAATLGGLDRLVFTGGIGEHAPAVREEVCAGLGHLGVRIDPESNVAGLGEIGTPGAACSVSVVAADEERVIARHTEALLGDRRPRAGAPETR